MTSTIMDAEHLGEISTEEAFEFAVCRDGEHVNVANVSYGEEERGAHIYSVTVEDGEPVECSCPHHQHRGVRCKHIHAVASNEVVQRAIEAAQAELFPGVVSPQKRVRTVRKAAVVPMERTYPASTATWRETHDGHGRGL